MKNYMKKYLAGLLFFGLVLSFITPSSAQVDLNQQAIVRPARTNYITVLQNGRAKRVSEGELRDSLKLDIEDKFYPTVVTNVLQTGNAQGLRNQYVRGTQDSIYKINSQGISFFVGFNGRQTKTAISYAALSTSAAIGESLLLPTGEMITKVSSKKWFSNKVLGAGTPVQYSIINTDTVSNEKAIWENPNISVVAGQTVAFIYYNAAWKPQKGFLDVEDFGAKGDGTTNDYAAIVACITYFENLGAGVIKCNNKTYKINTGLVLNPQKVRLSGDNTTLDFTSAPSSVTAIAWYNTGNGSPYFQADRGMEGVIIKGASSLNPSVGVKFYATGTLGSAHFSVKNCTITGFGVGEQYGDNSYLISNYNCDIWGCFRGVYIPPSLTNSGEGIKYIGSTIFNNKINLDLRWEGTTVMLIGTSLDYPDSINIYMEKGRLMLNNAHIEAGTARQIWVANGGTFESTITITGGLIYNSSAGGVTPRVDIEGKCSFTWNGGNCYNQGGGGIIVRGNIDAKIELNNVMCESQSDAAFFTPNRASYKVNSKQYNNGIAVTSQQNIYNEANTGSETTASSIESRNAGNGSFFGLKVNNVSLGAATQSIIGYFKYTHASSSTMTNAHAIYIETPSILSGAVTNGFGLRIASQKPAGVASGRAIFQEGTDDYNFFNGRTKFGSLGLAQSVIDIESTTGGVIFPRMTSTQRDAISPQVDGSVIYNTTTSKLQVRAGGAWVDLH